MTQTFAGVDLKLTLNQIFEQTDSRSRKAQSMVTFTGFQPSSLPAVVRPYSGYMQVGLPTSSVGRYIPYRISSP